MHTHDRSVSVSAVQGGARVQKNKMRRTCVRLLASSCSKSRASTPRPSCHSTPAYVLSTCSVRTSDSPWIKHINSCSSPTTPNAASQRSSSTSCAESSDNSVSDAACVGTGPS